MGRLWWVFAAVLIVSGATAWVFRTPGEVLAERTADELEGPAGIGALGHLEPHTEVLQINAPSALEPAVVQELNVRVGDRVEAGQILAVLDSRARKLADVEIARAAQVMAESGLAQVLAGARPGAIAAQEAMVERTRSRLLLAEKQRDRGLRLSASKAMSADDLDILESEVTVQQRELAHHEAVLVALKEVRDVDVHHAEAEVARACAALQRAEADLETSVIRSPVDGRILRIHSHPGERFRPEGLLELGDTREMHVVAEVHETDILKVRSGQPADVILRNEGLTLHGEVVEIGQVIGRMDVLSNDPVDDTDARVVEVRIRLSEEDSRRVQGLSYARVEVRIQATRGKVP